MHAARLQCGGSDWMKRDTKRFLVNGWKLLQIDYGIPIELSRIYQHRYGVLPDVDRTVVGAHFWVADSVRGILIVKPHRLQVEGALIRQVVTLIADRYRCIARMAESGEVPTFPHERLPTLNDHEVVELWPLPTAGRAADRLVAELVSARGWFAATERRSYRDPFPITRDVDEAMTFDSLEEAEAWLEVLAAHQQFELRYLAAVRAECDQRDSRIHDEMAS